MISVDKVYQTVLALANKEQRGYITPQEFNLYADHAQTSIFEQYFYDLNQFKRTPGNATEYSDMLKNLEEKINKFNRYRRAASLSTSTLGHSGIYASFDDIYRLGAVEIDYKGNGNFVKVEQVNISEKAMYENSPLTKPTQRRPIFIQYQDFNGGIRVFPNPGEDYQGPGTPAISSKLVISYIRKPKTPKWTYIVVNEKALYDHSASDRQDFELHPSDQIELIVKILQLSGVTIKDNNLVSIATQEEVKNIQQEKQ
mgnify:CR=1 FL=1